jgi:uncharacterized lipoprotein
MKKIALLVCVLAVSACQSLPERIIIAPNYTAAAQLSIANNIDLSVQDNRETPTTLRILKKDDVTKVASNDLVHSLDIALSKALKNSGVNINAASQNQMALHIHQLEVIVKQQTLKYRSEGIIELEVKLNKGSRSFNKYYNGSQNSEGPLIFDKAKVEGQLNTLLEQMISRIVNDAELKEFLQG